MNGFLETVVAQSVCHKINVFGWEQSLDYTGDSCSSKCLP